MQKLILTMLVVTNLIAIKSYAVTKFIYYCEAAYGHNYKYFKIGYSDRPCNIFMSEQQLITEKILLLEAYKKNYKIYSYEQEQIINQKQQICNKINEHIQQTEKLLIINKNNKIILNKLKRKLSRYKKLKQKSCSG